MGDIKITEDEDLKKLEKKAWRSTFDDGIFDIYFGILIISFGPSITFYEYLPQPLNFLIGPLIIGFGLAFFILIKKFIVQPRTGFVKFGRNRKTRKLKTAIVLAINMILLLILYILNLTDFGGIFNITNDFSFLIEGLLFIALPLCFVAYFLQYNRLYITAVLMGSAFYIANLLSYIIPRPFNFLTTYLTIGGIIIIIGLVYFIRFLKLNPLSKEETN
jgi:hypothetical protein